MAEISPEMAERVAKGKQWLDAHKDKPIEELLARMMAVRDNFVAELEGLSDDQVAFSPGEKQWSVKEVCLHVTNAVRAVAAVVHELSHGRPPDGVKDRRIGVLDPDPGSFEAVRAGLDKSFAGAIDSVKNFPVPPNLEVTAPHPFFGELNSRAWAAFNIMHVNVHINQVKRVKSSPGFPA